SAAAHNGDIVLWGARAATSEEAEEAPYGADELKPIGKAEFSSDRGFDFELCRITPISLYDADTPELYLEKLRVRAKEPSTWINVHVEKQGYVKWLKRQFGSIGKGLRSIG